MTGAAGEPPIGRRRLAAGAAVLVLCGQYFIAEAVTASAWRTPYGYARNYISDLGVTACLPRGPCSPWGAVFDASLILAAVFVIVAAVLLAPLVPQPGWRRLLVALALVHGLGSATVGLVHSAPGTPAGTPRLHLAGAYAAILGGNGALLVAGIGLRRPWIRPAFRWFSVGLACFGLASATLLVLTRTAVPGLLERGAVDTITVWEVASGVLLAARLRRRTAAG